MRKETEFSGADGTIQIAVGNRSAKKMRTTSPMHKCGMPVGRGSIMGLKRHRNKSTLARKKMGATARKGAALRAGSAARSGGAVRTGAPISAAARAHVAKPGEPVITDSKGTVIQSVAVHADVIHANAVTRAGLAVKTPDVMVKGMAAAKLDAVIKAALAAKSSTESKKKISFAGSIVSPSDFHM